MEYDTAEKVSYQRMLMSEVNTGRAVEILRPFRHDGRSAESRSGRWKDGARSFPGRVARIILELEAGARVFQWVSVSVGEWVSGARSRFEIPGM